MPTFTNNILFFFRKMKKRQKTTVRAPEFIAVECPKEGQDHEILFVHPERKQVLSKLPTIDEDIHEEILVENDVERLVEPHIPNERSYRMIRENKLQTILEETDEELLAEKNNERVVLQRKLYRSKFTCFQEIDNDWFISFRDYEEDNQ